FEQLKISPDAWQVCAEALAQRTYSDDHVKFFCFQVLEHQKLNPQPEKTFIRNKAAQVFALLFICTCESSWLLIQSCWIVMWCMRTSEEAHRNTLIKDTMREQCIPNLVESWYQILQNYQYTNSEVSYQCLEVVGTYVSWIDLSLIANDRFINMRLGQMSIEVLWEEACDCLFEVVNKGMDPIDKMKLVESLYQVLQSAGFFSIDQEDVDFLARFAKLVNGMGQSLIVSWSKLVKNGDIKNAQEALQAIETKVALMLQLLIHEDDDISSNITGFCYDYLHILKQLKCSRIKYNFENEGEDGAMFVEYRKLKLLLDRLLLLASVHRVFSSTLQNWQTTRFMEVEVAIRLLYILAEALPVSHGAHFSGDVSQASGLQDMIVRLWLWSSSKLLSDMKVLHVEPQHIPCVLMAFLDHRGLWHSSAKVRSRTVYLFSRFVRSLNKQMNPFTEDILNRIQDLLELPPPGNGHQSLLSSDDQLFTYETAGVLIVNTEWKQALMKKLMLAQDVERQASLADCLNHAVGFASRTSKAFINKQTVKQCGHSEVYLNCLQTFLQALSCPLHKGILRSGVPTFLHRMIICPEEEVLLFIPSASEHMLKDCKAEDLQKFIPLINQITDKFKIQVSPFLRQMFMPLLHAVFEVLLRPAEENDQSAALEKQMLRRSYFAFLRTVPGSGMGEVIANQGAENVEKVLVTVIQGAVEYPDRTAQKTCFIYWPECAVTLKTIHLKRGPECVQYLQQESLPSLQVVPEIIQEFCQALQQSDAKVFKNYLRPGMVFFQRARP
uniref:Exportin-T n=1 Tax=Colobus angolensis palliatus TaxID=336983 RepID=A0A2K5IEF0_COLAP